MRRLLQGLGFNLLFEAICGHYSSLRSGDMHSCSFIVVLERAHRALTVFRATVTLKVEKLHTTTEISILPLSRPLFANSQFLRWDCYNIPALEALRLKVYTGLFFQDCCASFSSSSGLRAAVLIFLPCSSSS